MKEQKFGNLGWSLLFIFVLAVIISSLSDEPKNLSQETSVKTNQEPSLQTPELNNPNFKIIYTITNKRFDGGVNYYVLIDPVDLSNDSFKEDIKAIVKQMVEKKGPNISIELHDKIESLQISYKQYGDLSLGRPRTNAEEKLMAIHYIAGYQGNLETGLYYNTLWYFPINTEVNTKYSGNEEFNPEEY